jgi:hypothetical protein
MTIEVPLEAVVPLDRHHDVSGFNYAGCGGQHTVERQPLLSRNLRNLGKHHLNAIFLKHHPR